MTPESFWAKVDRSGGPDACWPWMGGLSAEGYGVVYVSADGRNYRSHRYAKILEVGPLSPSALACHTCDTRLCCNPAHLYVGTHQTNGHDKVARGRQRNQYTVRQLGRVGAA